MIAKIFTEQHGLCSFLIQGARKKTSPAKANLLQPLSLVEIVAYHKETSGLQKVREMKNEYPLQSIQNDISKTTIALFLSEMLSRSINEETPNKPLFEFLYKAIIFLDTTGNPVNFHLLFLVKLSKFLGFYPQGIYSDDALYFNLPDGVFVNEKPQHPHFIPPELSKTFRQFLVTDFNEMQNINLSGHTRKVLLESIIDYYRLHLTGVKEIKSHQVLETVLGGG